MVTYKECGQESSKGSQEGSKMAMAKSKGTGEDRLSFRIICFVPGGGQHLGLTLGIP